MVADLRVAVPRDAAGDLADGVETVVGRVESVATVEAVDVTGLTPRLNDLAVEARVDVRVDVDGVSVEDDGPIETDGGVVRPADDAVAAALGEGFGVDVDDVEVG